MLNSPEDQRPWKGLVKTVMWGLSVKARTMKKGSRGWHVKHAGDGAGKMPQTALARRGLFRSSPGGPRNRRAKMCPRPRAGGGFSGPCLEPRDERRKPQTARDAFQEGSRRGAVDSCPKQTSARWSRGGKTGREDKRDFGGVTSKISLQGRHEKKKKNITQRSHKSEPS